MLAAPTPATAAVAPAAPVTAVVAHATPTTAGAFSIGLVQEGMGSTDPRFFF